MLAKRVSSAGEAVLGEAAMPRYFWSMSACTIAACASGRLLLAVNRATETGQPIFEPARPTPIWNAFHTGDALLVTMPIGVRDGSLVEVAISAVRARDASSS